MNIREQLLEEHSKINALKVAHYACVSENNFKELIKCFTSDNYVLAQRAAWSVSWAAAEKPEMVYPHIKALVAVLKKKNVHPAVVRNSVRVLLQLDIPQKYHGEVMNACFQFLETATTPVAIKVFSLTTLLHLSEHYPEIKHELKLVIDENLPNETAAFAARAKKVLPKL